MKAGGSAGHGLVLSCQGAECRPWAHSRGKSWVEGEGDPKMREDEKGLPYSPGVYDEETDGRSWKSLRVSFFVFLIHRAPSSPHTTDFMSSRTVMSSVD